MVQNGNPLTEEQFVGQFYRTLKQKIADHGKIELQAWNGIYDLSFLESVTHRYDSLKEYRGFFSDQAKAGTFEYFAAENSLFNLVWAYGRENKDFAARYLARRVRTRSNTGL